MLEYLQPIIGEKGANMTIEERNLIAIAFKNLVAL